MEPPTTLHLLIAGVVLLREDSAVITPLHCASKLRLRWPRKLAVTLSERELTDPMLSGVWGHSIFRLELDVTGCESISVTVENEQDEGEGSR